MELPPKSKYSEIIAHDTPEDLAAARDADLGVTNYYTSYARQFGPDLPVHRDPRAAEAAKSRPHYSRRGGRSYNEGSDSEHDPNWAITPVQITPEEIASNHTAIGMLKVILSERRRDPAAEAVHAVHLDEVREQLDAERADQ